MNVNEQEQNKMKSHARARANQVRGVVSSLIIQRAEQASEEYVSQNGFEGEDKENRKQEYIETFKEFTNLA